MGNDNSAARKERSEAGVCLRDTLLISEGAWVVLRKEILTDRSGKIVEPALLAVMQSVCEIGAESDDLFRVMAINRETNTVIISPECEMSEDGTVWYCC